MDYTRRTSWVRVDPYFQRRINWTTLPRTSWVHVDPHFTALLGTAGSAYFRFKMADYFNSVYEMSVCVVKLIGQLSYVWIYLSSCLPVCLSVFPSVRLSVCPLVCLFICLKGYRSLDLEISLVWPRVWLPTHDYVDQCIDWTCSMELFASVVDNMF